MRFEEVNIGDNFAYSIGFCSRNDQILYLAQCKITKPEFEALCIAFGDENVMILYDGFRKPFRFLVFLFLFDKMNLSQLI